MNIVFLIHLVLLIVVFLSDFGSSLYYRFIEGPCTCMCQAFAELWFQYGSYGKPIPKKYVYFRTFIMFLMSSMAFSFPC